MAEKRKNWNGLISGFSASDLVFLDESGCNTDMTRRYAYSFGGNRAVDSAPLSKPKNTTILSSIPTPPDKEKQGRLMPSDLAVLCYVIN